MQRNVEGSGIALPPPRVPKPSSSSSRAPKKGDKVGFVKIACQREAVTPLASVTAEVVKALEYAPAPLS